MKSGKSNPLLVIEQKAKYTNNIVTRSVYKDILWRRFGILIRSRTPKQPINPTNNGDRIV